MEKPLSRDILPAALKQREAIKAALLQHICNERVITDAATIQKSCSA